MFFTEIWNREKEMKWAGVKKKKLQKVSMMRIYHNHTLQTNPWWREEEPQNTNSHKISGRQLKQSDQLSLLVKIIAKLEMTQSSA